MPIPIRDRAATPIRDRDGEEVVVRVIEAHHVTEFLEGTREHHRQVVIREDFDPVEERLVEAAPHQGASSPVALIAMANQSQRLAERLLDRPHVRQRGLKLRFGVPQLLGDAILFRLEQIKRHGTGEVGTQQVGPLRIQVLDGFGQPMVVGVDGRSTDGELAAEGLADGLGEFVIDLDESPALLDSGFEPIAADVGEGAAVASAVPHALEVVVGAAMARVAGEGEARLADTAEDAAA